MTRHVVIAGYGYTGHFLAPLLTDEGSVTAIARSGLNELPDGVIARTADLGTPQSAVTDADVVIYLAPPPASGDRDTTLEAFLTHADAPQRFVYASTSGVYGDCAGELVDESRAPAPQTARALRRHAAEQALTDWCGERNTQLVILRVAGIYGPGRLPLDRVRRREPVLREEDAGPGNRIHVEDLAAALASAALHANPPGIVNVCDGNHASSTAYTKLVAKVAGLPAPPEIALAEARDVFSPMRWSFLAESRRLDNTRLVRELGVTLRYADLRAGIEASLVRT